MNGNSDSLVRCACQRAVPHGPSAPSASSVTREPLTYRLAEAAQRIGGVTERWLATELRAGRISGHKIGRQWRMSEADIQDIINRSRVVPRTVSVVEATVVERPRQIRRPALHPVVGEQYALFD